MKLLIRIMGQFGFTLIEWIRIDKQLPTVEINKPIDVTVCSQSGTGRKVIVKAIFENGKFTATNGGELSLVKYWCYGFKFPNF